MFISEDKRQKVLPDLLVDLCCECLRKELVSRCWATLFFRGFLSSGSRSTTIDLSVG